MENYVFLHKKNNKYIVVCSESKEMIDNIKNNNLKLAKKY